MGLLDQLIGGASREAIAGTLGAPVDLTAGAINASTAALGSVLPQGFPAITNPVGGSEWLAQWMRDVGTLSDTPGTPADAIGGLLPMLIGPLKDGALKDACGLLEALARGDRPRPIDIGNLTPEQFEAINKARAQLNMPEFSSPDVYYRGTHHYNSRVTEQVPPYSIDDMLQQIDSGMSAQSRVVMGGRSPVLENPTPRVNESGVPVRDQAVLNYGRGGQPELFSVVPKGDGRKKK
ncbi:hypothetical protein [Burkholderia multivorans]|uniref:hypothetical protein n=1 Tax=Burkholderia multivorans TaxID=87883 RepID=UPI000CFE5649|nr:hypothetical protein [Burkholderia multivorans]PRG17972.1 hypothetical protein C6Q35_28380 [Burkholderia multivorans]